MTNTVQTTSSGRSAFAELANTAACMPQTFPTHCKVSVLSHLPRCLFSQPTPLCVCSAPSTRSLIRTFQENTPVYSVVFDAGSTGSRVHVFEFEAHNGELELKADTFEQLKPGLSDAGWADDPQASAASLQPLLDIALNTVPEALQPVTPVEVRSHAGTSVWHVHLVRPLRFSRL